MDQEPKIDPVTISSMAEIESVTERFKPDAGTEVRKMLMQGLEDIKKRSIIVDSFNSSVKEEEFGDYPPVKPNNIVDGFHWVDKMVKERMDAKIIDSHIVWDLDDGRHVFNPYTGDIEYNVDDSRFDGDKTASDMEAEAS